MCIHELNLCQWGWINIKLRREANNIDWYESITKIIKIIYMEWVQATPNVTFGHATPL